MFGDDGKPLTFSSKLIKISVYEAGLGIEKTFFLDLFRSGSSFGASSFDVEDRPLPQYAAYRTMTHRLEHAKFVADLSTTGAEVYLFNRHGKPVIVLWSNSAHEAVLPWSAAKATAINIMDVESQVNTSNGKLRLKVSDIPQFVEGGNMELLTTYGNILKIFPRELVVKPGNTTECNLSLDNSVSGLKLAIPMKWSGTIARNKLKISVPQGAPEGIYDVSVSVTVKGYQFTVPVLVDVNSSTQGANLVKNGDFSLGSAYWFFPKDKNKFAVVKGAGVDGQNAARTRGTVFFGPSWNGVKVRPGEKYVFIVEARGAGLFGGLYSLYDKDGNRIFPKNPGINCLVGKPSKNWKTFSEKISIPQSAARLSVALMANYGDKENKEIFFNRFAIIRLTDRFPRSKRFGRAYVSKPWESRRTGAKFRR